MPKPTPLLESFETLDTNAVQTEIEGARKDADLIGGGPELLARLHSVRAKLAAAQAIVNEQYQGLTREQLGARISDTTNEDARVKMRLLSEIKDSRLHQNLQGLQESLSIETLKAFVEFDEALRPLIQALLEGGHDRSFATFVNTLCDSVPRNAVTIAPPQGGVGRLMGRFFATDRQAQWVKDQTFILNGFLRDCEIIADLDQALGLPAKKVVPENKKTLLYLMDAAYQFDTFVLTESEVDGKDNAVSLPGLIARTLVRPDFKDGVTSSVSTKILVLMKRWPDLGNWNQTVKPLGTKIDDVEHLLALPESVLNMDLTFLDSLIPLLRDPQLRAAFEAFRDSDWKEFEGLGQYSAAGLLNFETLKAKRLQKVQPA